MSCTIDPDNETEISQYDHETAEHPTDKSILSEVDRLFSLRHEMPVEKLKEEFRRLGLVK